jgi:biopolymer transport protein ExbD
VKLRVRRKEDPEINVTSFIDVVLLLLFFFVLTTKFADEARINIRLPEASAKTSKDPARTAIEVAVTAEGSYSVNGQNLINTSPATLSKALAKLAGEDRSSAITIRADARATHQSVVTAMDVVGRLGFRTINIATSNSSPRPAATTRQ